MKKNKTLIVILLLLAAGAAGVIAMRFDTRKSVGTDRAAAKVPSSSPLHTSSSQVSKVPAYQSAEQSRRLGPSLDPNQFFGKAREAYQIARRIPATLAQLPCYCHCDQSFGHKSLYTCFEDDHASHCAVCVDEALLAYQLQSQEKLTAEQVRNRIIEKYSTGHGHTH